MNTKKALQRRIAEIRANAIRLSNFKGSAEHRKMLLEFANELEVNFLVHHARDAGNGDRDRTASDHRDGDGPT